MELMLEFEAVVVEAGFITGFGLWIDLELTMGSMASFLSSLLNSESFFSSVMEHPFAARKSFLVSSLYEAYSAS